MAEDEGALGRKCGHVKGLSAEEVVRALPPEVLEALARQLKANGPSSKPQ